MNNIYFNGRCKALETKLLSLVQLNEIVKCKEVAEVVNLLNSYNFLKGESVANFQDLLVLIEREEKEFLQFLKRTTPNPNFAKFFTLKYDYFNVESIYIATKLEKDSYPTLLEGQLKIDTIIDLIKSQKYNLLSPQMENCLKYCDELFKKEQFTGFSIDTAFKKALYEEIAESSKTKLLKKYTTFLIDMQNISLASRLRDKTLFQTVRLRGGSLKDEVLFSLCTDEPAEILMRTRNSDYTSAIKLIVSAWEKGETFFRFDYMFDCFPISFFDKYKYETVGYAPYLRYCFLKETELINLRIIIEGLISNRNRQRISNELRRVYE